MNLRFLKTFLAVHNQGSISQAAERVHLSPAAVSAQLKALEAELGLNLYVRTGCALVATPEAARLAPLARDMLATHERMRALAGAPMRPRVLRLGAIGSSLPEVVPQVLACTRRTFPDTEIKVAEGTSADLVQKVRSDALDCAIVTQPLQALGAELISQTLYSDPFVTIAPADTVDLSLEALLERLPYVAFDRGTWAGQMIEDYLDRASLRVTPTMELDSLQGVSAIVRGGAGMSIIPWVRGASWTVSEGISVRRLPGFNRPVALVQRREKAQPSLRDAWAASLSANAAQTH